MVVPKFPEVERIPVGKQGLIGRHIMSEEKVSRLLADNVVIEEKLDGKTVGTAYFSPYIVYGEYLKWRHTIPYDGLPAWIVGFDVLDTRSGLFLARKEKESVLEDARIPIVPLIFQGKIESKEDLLPFLDTPSVLSTKSFIEGIVVKNYKFQIMGKIVTYEFLTGLEKEPHWLKRKREMNKLKLLPFFVLSIAMRLEGWEYS